MTATLNPEERRARRREILAGFIENFCASQPKHLDTYRETMTQPYVYWTLKAPFATIIGLYSNSTAASTASGDEQQRGPRGSWVRRRATSA